MTFGPDTVTMVLLSQTGTPDALGEYTLTETLVDAPGCHDRPLTFKELVELGIDIATEVWKTTIPISEYDDALQTSVLALKNDDVIRINGVERQVVGGLRPFKDFEAPFKATIISQKHRG